MKLPTWATRLIQVLVVLLIIYAALRLTGFNIIVEGMSTGDVGAEAQAMADQLKKTLAEMEAKTKELKTKI